MDQKLLFCYFGQYFNFQANAFYDHLQRALNVVQSTGGNLHLSMLPGSVHSSQLYQATENVLTEKLNNILWTNSPCRLNL